MTSPRVAALVLLVAVALSVLFWAPLWRGHGLAGGDLYPYFFPQKVFLSERLRAGELPLWNNLTGFGYPILGESQTGAVYPPHLLAYGLLEVDAAYRVEHLLHYLICFLGAWLYARRLGLGRSGALLAALVFSYGWFPPRVGLEWAIVTGAWLPVALWCATAWLDSGRERYALGLAATLGLQLLAGHFQLAFVTHLLVVAWSVFRLWPEGSVTAPAVARARGAGVLLALTAAFLLAAVALVPAWELKTRSTRAAPGVEHDPAYGHLPPLAITQLVAPWRWYSPRAIDAEDVLARAALIVAPWHRLGPDRELDETIRAARAGAVDAPTNKVEAALYAGLVPLALALAGMLRALRGDRALRFWLVGALLALVYATGWLVPVVAGLPGFGYFRGPARMTVVAILAIALLAGRGLEALLERLPSLVLRRLAAAAVLAVSACDLWLVSRMVTYAGMVAEPPIRFREASPIRAQLLAEPGLPRLWAPGRNSGNLLGVSCLPIYLGLAPSEYADPSFAPPPFPGAEDGDAPRTPSPELVAWLEQAGVTHLLTFTPIDAAAWKASELGQGVDPMLNLALGRAEPLHLYRLQGPGRVRVHCRAPGVSERSSWRVADGGAGYRANRVAIDVEVPVGAAADPGCELELRDLAYPGWEVAVDGQPAASGVRRMFRAVAVPPGRHQVVWRYRPRSVALGAVLSAATTLLLAGTALARLRRRRSGW